MQDLIELFRHNAWANAGVFNLVVALDADLLEGQAPGTRVIGMMTHSAQHRSQVLSWLSAKGVPTPDLDYVLMLQEEHSA